MMGSSYFKMGSLRVLFFFGLLFSIATANKETLNQNNNQVCSGMYSKKDHGGKIDPFISFNMKKLSENDPGVVVAIFDFQDYEHLGAPLDDGDYYYICDDYAIEQSYCKEDQRDQFIVREVAYDPFSETNRTLVNKVMSFTQNSQGLHENKYPVTKTGYYCVLAMQKSSSTKFQAIANFRNAYGHLAASEINKLPLYGLLAIGYVVAMALYSFAFWRHKHELLPLQKYLLAFFVFLTAESIFVWAYYNIQNEKGDSAGIKVYMVFLSILTAGKVTFSFFLLLIIALGYGIVYPKLNKTLMRRCQFFAALNFSLCVGFLIQSYLGDPESTSLLILITLIPVSISMFAFYFMILKSMTKTVRYLKDQRQVVKLGMYKKLLTIIYASLLIILAGLVISSFVFLGMNTVQMIEQHWRTRFFFTDFWPTLVYFGVFVTFAFIWRPTDTSYMLACSQQLPTDPENVADFDLDDLQSMGELDNEFDDTIRDEDMNFTDEEDNQPEQEEVHHDDDGPKPK
ncbi:YHL017W and PTM1 (YKL039W) [Zygosaccharomyces parabailii]|nr:YHL017W and PTM1 (YKL039W) [Zygosaccharomyces parabailii]